MFASAAEDRWLAFVGSVDSLNTFERHSVLRKYQADLLDTGTFHVISPNSGKQVSVTRSAMLGGRIAYLIPERARSWLVTGPTRFGYPLWELITEMDGARRQIGGDSAPSIRVSKEEIEILRNFQSDKTDLSNHAITLFVGEDNFAHHLWNELAGLDEWVTRRNHRAIEKLAIVASAEPLGPLERIFPDLSEVSIERPITCPSQVLLETAPIVTRVGSCLVTTQLRKRIQAYSKEYADRSVTQDERSVLENSRPNVWISIRVGSRTAENLADFLFEIVRKLFAAYPDAAVLFDGFSFPVAFFDDPRTKKLRTEFITRASTVNSFIQDIRERVFNQLGLEVSRKLRSVSGLGLLDAIELGSLCDYYVCHAGTLQHKIAWIHNRPGLIHMPLNSRSRAQWHAAQVENGIVPDLLPEGISVSTDPPTSGRIRDRNYNYRILDVPRAAEWALASMQSHITGISPV